ncbi:MAG: ComF family protein [Candidatus Levybacteria bacterium]|nr:ComF family protein [Candidatus Levybacteria bacterium]
MKLLDLIFPKYCVNCKKFGDYLCPDCFSRLSFDTKNICLACGNPSFDGLTHPRCSSRYRIDGSFTGVVFNPISKKLIYQFKYKPYLSGLSSFLTDLLYESLIQNEEFNKVLRLPLMLVPIPLSPKRFKKRGYNQAEILAKSLSKKFGSPVVNYLVRTRETRSQVGLTKEKRKENVSGAFALRKNVRGPATRFPPASARSRNTDIRAVWSPSTPVTPHILIENKNIILIDDVLTTGSTFSEAGNVLKRAGAAKVWAIAFAREQ